MGSMRSSQNLQIWLLSCIVSMSALCLATAEALSLSGPQALPSEAFGDTLSLGSGYDYEGVSSGDVTVNGGGTLNMYDGAYVAWGVNAYAGGTVDSPGGVVNIYNCAASTMVTTFTGGSYPGLAPEVSVYGPKFRLGVTEYEPGTAMPISGVLEVISESEPPEVLFSVTIYSECDVCLKAPEGGDNAKPVAYAGEDVSIFTSEQAAPTILTGTATDADDDAMTYRWLEGTTELKASTPVPADGVVTLDLSTLPPFSVGNHTLTLEVRETGGEQLEASDDMTLRVLAPPEITEITIEPTPLGSPTEVTATFSDADGGTHTATIMWEEAGEPESGVVSETEWSVAGLHTYATTGVYTVTVTVTDKDGGTASSTAYAAVYDPDACSFVTGAGWIADEGSTCGKAFLGLFVRQWGSGAPRGWMRFRWGDSRFSATELDWLVVSEDKSSAWFTGVGTINGAGEYYFLVEIGDETDSIWITIFDEYDTGGMVDLVRGRIRIRQWG